MNPETVVNLSNLDGIIPAFFTGPYKSIENEKYDCLCFGKIVL